MKRLTILDVVRGFAIFGTLGTNIWIFAKLGDISTMFELTNNWWTTSDGWLNVLGSILINGKFLSLLTILFGVGLAIKYERTLKKGQPWPKAYIWSAILLFIDGFIHFLLVFEYDILMSYAITAIIVSFLVTKSSRTLKWIISILGLLHVAIITLITILFNTLLNDEQLRSELISDNNVFASLYMNGSWLEQIVYRFEHLLSLRLEAMMVLPMNTGLFLIGILLVRANAFASNASGRKIRQQLFKWGMVIGLPLNMLILVNDTLFSFAGRYLFAPVLALGYIGLFAFILEKGYIKFITNRLQEIGRTALSCYILQNILASIIFYGWGFGLGAVNNAWLTVLMAFVICVMMMTFAYFWLLKFRQGPIEAIWRYASNLPFRQKAQASHPKNMTT
ncbi:DUF418 domain-containing protein [Bacillus aquiflavi]|uniref:DUF418 domain-containing protein n=1 Tax=Bacillus aquiflavi TaxID=2672567 RepID=A0A6B3VZT9_9BACI|nr:DUF418 domain-containing protein [Bacillus aquiflavi]MBA4536876.1 DUF418 domain-containing protein [Bacillus aquiflavi]NEY81243.1 DUF418 domain-containing protein [Bacillus aquiflavi]UAC48450.1 DUF418 domain-containing protein [Bacillus aquiflavi]